MNAFVCDFDIASGEVSFKTLPVVDGVIQDDAGSLDTLEELERDPYATAIAVTDEEDNEGLRFALEAKIRRRFDFLKVPTHESGFIGGRKPR